MDYHASIFEPHGVPRDTGQWVRFVFHVERFEGKSTLLAVCLEDRNV